MAGAGFALRAAFGTRGETVVWPMVENREIEAHPTQGEFCPLPLTSRAHKYLIIVLYRLFFDEILPPTNYNNNQHVPNVSNQPGKK